MISLPQAVHFGTYCLCISNVEKFYFTVYGYTNEVLWPVARLDTLKITRL